MADDKNQNPNNTQAGAQGGDDNGANNSNNGNANGNNGDQGNNGKGNEPMIPKSRLDEELKARRELEKWKADREKADQEAEAERLKKQGEYEKLAEQEKQKRIEVEERFSKTSKINALKLEAIKAGTVDADAVVALAKLDDIKLSEDGSVDTTSVQAIIENMKASKKYLFGTGDNSGNNNTNIGADGGAPNGGSNTTPTFKRSQLSDPKFYKENREAILQAQREGKIVDDVTPKSS